MRRAKRGQGTEMIGLLVIIILLLVLVVMYLRFANKPGTDITATSMVSTQSSNLLNAMMLYSVCEGKDFKDAIIGCAGGNAQICGKPSCDIVKGDGTAILSATLRKAEIDKKEVFFSILDNSTMPPTILLKTMEEKDLKCATRKNCPSPTMIPLTKIIVRLCRCVY